MYYREQRDAYTDKAGEIKDKNSEWYKACMRQVRYFDEKLKELNNPEPVKAPEKRAPENDRGKRVNPPVFEEESNKPNGLTKLFEIWDKRKAAEPKKEAPKSNATIIRLNK